MAEESHELNGNNGSMGTPVKDFFTRNLALEQRGLLGTVIFFITILMVGWYGVNEPNRLGNFTTQYDARQVMRGAILFEENCTECHGADGTGLPSVAPALNYEGMFNGERLAEVGWTGTLEDYVKLTIAAGRPVGSGQYAQVMPTWGQDYGGPMRVDQVEDVTAFVMNYGLQWEEGYEPVTDFIPPTPTPLPYDPVGTDVATALPVGAPARGEAMFLGDAPGPDGQSLACQSCHSIDGSVMTGPSMLGVTDRVPAGYDSFEIYTHEAIVLPCDYIAAGFEDGGCVMPQNFGTRLDAQSLADIIAYLQQLNGQ